MRYTLGPRARFVYEALLARIVDDGLQPGSKLPPHTLLAQEFGVAPLTVRQGLAQLEQDGVLSCEQGRGTFVRSRPDEREGAEEGDRPALADRLSHLAELGNILASSLDFETTLANVVNLAVPRLADWCAISVLEDDSSLTHLAGAHIDPEKDQITRRIQPRYPYDPDAEFGVGRVLRTGEPELIPTLTEEQIVAVNRSPQDTALLRDLIGKSLLTVPLWARGRVIGAIGMAITQSDRRYGPADLALAQEFAGLAALGIDNAALYRRSREAEERLQHQLDLFRAIFETSATGIELADLDGNLIATNRAIQQMLGYSESELQGLHWTAITHPDDIALEEALDEELVAGTRDQYQIETRQLRKDGQIVWTRQTVSEVRNEAGEAQFAVCMIEDISERKEAERKLLEAEAKYRTLVEQLPVAAYLTQIDGSTSTVYISPEIEVMLGYSQEEWMADSTIWDTLLHPDDRERVRAEFRASVQSSGRFASEYRLLARSGEQVWVRDEAVTVKDPEREVCFQHGVLIDITERKKAEAALEYQALHDALTDLPNRTLLQDRLQQATVTAHREDMTVALLFMDLDNFKDVNDSLGHQCGDQLLQHVGARLRGAIRESDTVARLGGDEFAVVLPNAQPRGAAQAARKILTALERPIVIEGQRVGVHASIGIAIYPQNGGDADELMQRADIAMYIAKRNNSGYAFYTADHEEASPLHLVPTRELRSGIEHNELRVFYQPKVDLLTGRATCIEALARWQHPQRGLMKPELFIPLAEQRGLIRQLTLWMLKAAMRQAKSWSEDGLAVPVAVNLSARSLQDTQMVQGIRRLLRQNELAPSQLQVEITESALMAERAQETLTYLHDLGISIAIDDFGTGYSSLSYLRGLPIDEVKIDKSFVMDLGGSEDNAMIVHAIIDLARNLRLRVVAEGVENRAVADMLLSLGCHLAQGNYLAPPLSSLEITEWLLRSQEGA